jgi:phosphatidate cytidylyltransferase
MLRTRIITALIMFAIALVTLFVLPRPWPAMIFAVLATLMAWEWAGLMRVGMEARLVFATAVIMSCFYLWFDQAFYFSKLWLLSAVFWLLFVPFWLWKGWRISGSQGREFAGYLTGLVVIVPTWAAVAALQEWQATWLLLIMGTAWIADICAYFAGRAWGRHKLAPSISPNKTWEGVVGAMVGVCLYCIIAASIMGIPWMDKLIWTPWILVLVAVSVIGDLFESMIKRQAGVKDSSNLLPGHGGFLDRLDSQTSMLPLAALIFFFSGQIA